MAKLILSKVFNIVESRKCFKLIDIEEIKSAMNGGNSLLIRNLRHIAFLTVWIWLMYLALKIENLAIG